MILIFSKPLLFNYMVFVETIASEVLKIKFQFQKSWYYSEFKIQNLYRLHQE